MIASNSSSVAPSLKKIGCPPDVNPTELFSDWEHRPEANMCSSNVTRIPGRLMWLHVAVGNETEYKRFSYIHCRAVRVHIVLQKNTDVYQEWDPQWFCENCKYVIWGLIVQDKHLASFFFTLGLRITWNLDRQKISPIFYLQTSNTREGDAENRHYKMLHVKRSF